MNMIFYGLFGNIEFGSDFFIRAATPDHLYQLLFSPGETHLILHFKTWQAGPLRRDVGEQRM